MSDNDVSVWVHQFNKATTLVGDVDDAGGYACVEGRNISEPSDQFCHELKTVVQKYSSKTNLKYVYFQKSKMLGEAVCHVS